MTSTVKAIISLTFSLEVIGLYITVKAFDGFYIFYPQYVVRLAYGFAAFSMFCPDLPARMFLRAFCLEAAKDKPLSSPCLKLSLNSSSSNAKMSAAVSRVSSSPSSLPKERQSMIPRLFKILTAPEAKYSADAHENAEGSSSTRSAPKQVPSSSWSTLTIGPALRAGQNYCPKRRRFLLRLHASGHTQDDGMSVMKRIIFCNNSYYRHRLFSLGRSFVSTQDDGMSPLLICRVCIARLFRRLIAAFHYI